MAVGGAELSSGGPGLMFIYLLNVFNGMPGGRPRAFELYGEPLIHERHRHRYEVNNDYRTALTDAGMRLCGMSPDGRIVEMLELPDHPYFLATQAHPEFNSRPNHPHPLFL